MISTLADFASAWRDTPESHSAMFEYFKVCVNADQELKAHRDYIETNIYGFGERAFHYLWKLIVDEMPPEFRFLEIGVHRGQVLSLVGLLSKRTKRHANIMGVSPYDGREVGEPRDYRKDVLQLFYHCNLNAPFMLVGDSVERETVATVQKYGPFDVAYIDGSHAYEDVRADIQNYSPMVKAGGYLVCDDAACAMRFPSSGFFTGIDEVSRAVDECLPPKGIAPQWTHLGNVGHNRIWRKS